MRRYASENSLGDKQINVISIRVPFPGGLDCRNMSEVAEPVLVASPERPGETLRKPAMAHSQVNMDSTQALELYQRIAANIAKVMRGQAASTRKLLAALASTLR